MSGWIRAGIVTSPTMAHTRRHWEQELNIRKVKAERERMKLTHREKSWVSATVILLLNSTFLEVMGASARFLPRALFKITTKEFTVESFLTGMDCHQHLPCVAS